MLNDEKIVRIVFNCLAESAQLIKVDGCELAADHCLNMFGLCTAEPNFLR